MNTVDSRDGRLNEIETSESPLTNSRLKADPVPPDEVSQSDRIESNPHTALPDGYDSKPIELDERLPDLVPREGTSTASFHWLFSQVGQDLWHGLFD